jgi:hypothetical protein
MRLRARSILVTLGWHSENGGQRECYSRDKENAYDDESTIKQSPDSRKNTYPDSTYAVVPKALEISASVTFSASLTCTPPRSDDASATLRLMSVNQTLKADASPGALAARMVETSRRISSEPWTTSAGLAPVNRLRNACCTVDRPSGGLEIRDTAFTRSLKWTSDFAATRHAQSGHATLEL